MKSILTLIMGVICSLAFNTVMGATIAGIAGIDPCAGAIVGNCAGFGLAAIGSVSPVGALRAGIFTEAWTGECIKAFRTAMEAVGWYNLIRDYSSYAENDVIHFVNIGGDPEVLVNNTTYPLDVQDLEDGDKAVSLDKYQSKPTRITDDELHAISYDKMQSVIERHKDAFFETKFARAIHAIAPAENKTLTPVKLTSGEAGDGRKRLCRADIIALKNSFDKMKVPAEGRVLVLCADHVADLLTQDQKFAGQYYDYTSGRIARLYGFDVYEYTQCPYYNVSTLKKVAYGAVPGTSDMQASVAFSAKRCMRADGTTKVYLQEAANNPTTQENLFSMRTYTICLPLKEEALAAIVSAKAS